MTKDQNGNEMTPQEVINFWWPPQPPLFHEPENKVRSITPAEFLKLFPGVEQVVEEYKDDANG